MKKNVFIDLDGTIFDVSERIYQVYKDILQKNHKKFLSKREYIKLKRKKIPIKEILKKTDAKDIYLKFRKGWEEKIEAPYYLDFDRVSFLTKKVLLYLKNYYKLILITLRSHPRRAFNQLRRKKIDRIFDRVLVTSTSSKYQRWKAKCKILKKYEKLDKDFSVIIGDTETDILVGKYFGIKTIAIVNGMRNREFLEKYKPDFLIRDISEVKNILRRE